MSDWAIKVEGVGKLYRVGARAPYHRFTDLVTGLVKAPLALLGSRQEKPPVQPVVKAETDHRFSDAPPGYFWSLRDISFEIPEGQVVGIIGRNGAGKSTLLKLLSRITEPTTGKIQIRGRVGSLLEVGTGFHPELSGRENIYLNGAILGMKRPEIKRKFDEIVAFAEVEKFLDSPVKHYSSGMYMRLAFAVAAHLEPEVLIVDEVLAVGDAQFQNKCLGKMGEVAKSGRTVLFVSHNLSAVKSLCNLSVLLHDGQVIKIGDTGSTLDAYTNQLSATTRDYPVNLDPQITIHRFDVKQRGTTTKEIVSSEAFEVEIEYELFNDLTGFRVGIFLNSGLLNVFRSLHTDWDASRETAARGRYLVRLVVPARVLLAGTYNILLHASCYGVIDFGYKHSLSHVIMVYAANDYNAAHPDEKLDSIIMPQGSWSQVKVG